MNGASTQCYIDSIDWVPMGIPYNQITALTADTLREFSRGLTLAGVTATDGSVDRVELLIRLAGCHSGECRLMLNLPRTDPGRFERALREKLREAIQRHRDDGGTARG